MILPPGPTLSAPQRRALDDLLAATQPYPPPDLAALIRDRLHIDLSTTFAGWVVPHPFGKASGQLSCTRAQVADDVAAGIAFVVLKTVIAEDGEGARTMGDWAERETRMTVERITSASGRLGWTVTWSGRGWHGTLDSYLTLCRETFALGVDAEVPVIPSVKFHLPQPGAPYQTSEYRHTMGRLIEAWSAAGTGFPLTVEKDFSPTLAGDRRAAERSTVLGWLERVPQLMRDAVDQPIRVGVKVMNALFDDGFQVEMLDTVQRANVDYAVVFNRLFDPNRGVAFGGWDLSDRNLQVLDRARRRVPWSATGNICSGRMMMEYALRGCATGQIHTFFQLPRTEYLAPGGSRTAAALHTLMLHPEHGIVPWMWHGEHAGLVVRRDGMLRFADLVAATA